MRVEKKKLNDFRKRKVYPAMVIKAINTFIATSTMFAELADLEHTKIQTL